MTPTQRSFTVSKSIIIHLIKSQAGTLGKALMECVMNGVDAGATRIDITLDRKGYVVQDNGHGFQTTQEIDAYFSVFGFDHDTEAEAGKRLYGQFGLGRGQQWNWARTRWRTRTFEMDVDIRARGLDYLLREQLPDEPGTTITGTFYEPISTAQVLEHTQHLKDLVKYSVVPVYLNGMDITTHPDTVKAWTQVTDEAWIQAKEYGPLLVYNQGMFVAQLSSYIAGCSGVVVTRPGHALELNMARNDILDTPGGLWQRLKKLLKTIGEERTRNASTRVTETDLRRFAAQIAVLDAEYEPFLKLRLFTDAAGKNLTIGKLITSLKATGLLTLHSAEHASLSRRAMDNQMATVLDARTLERWNVESLAELVEVLQRYVRQGMRFHVPEAFSHGHALEHVRVEEDITKAVPDLRGFYTLSAKPEGYPLAVLRGLRAVSGDLQRAVWSYRQARQDTPTGAFQELGLSAGDSDVADLWTDAARVIALHEERLVRIASVQEVERLLLDLIGLLLPGVNTMVAAEETPAEELRDFLLQEAALTGWTLRAVQGIVTEAARMGVKVPHRMVQVLGKAEGLEDQDLAVN